MPDLFGISPRLLAKGCVGLAVLLISYAAWLFFRVNAVRRWPSVQGTVKNVALDLVSRGSTSRYGDDDDDSEPTYRPSISYTYEVDGRRYSGEQIMLGYMPAMSHEDAMDFVRPYRAGRPVKVYFKRSDPGEALLKPRANTWVMLGCALAGVAILGVAAYLHDTRAI